MKGKIDKTTLTEIFTRAGIVWEWDGIRRELIVKEGAGPKNLGYHTFVAILYFTPEGALDSIGVWE